MAFALTEQQRQEHVVAADHGHQIGVDDALPLGDRDVFRQAVGQDADVVHHDVDPAKLSQREVTDRHERIWHADVGRVRRSIRAVACDVRGEFCSGVEVDRHHVGTPCRQGARAGQTDPAGGAGDDRDLAAQLLHHATGSTTHEPWRSTAGHGKFGVQHHQSARAPGGKAPWKANPMLWRDLSMSDARQPSPPRRGPARCGGRRS